MESKVTAEAAVEPYERLAELAEAELALCEEERFEELGELYERGAALVATLPAQAPTEAREALERAARAQAAVARRLAADLAEARSQLGQLRRGRDAARSYAASAAAGSGH
jgi:hypothetical protein